MGWEFVLAFSPWKIGVAAGALLLVALGAVVTIDEGFTRLAHWLCGLARWLGVSRPGAVLAGQTPPSPPAVLLARRARASVLAVLRHPRARWRTLAAALVIALALVAA